MKKLLAALLCVCMVVSVIMPMSVFAADTTGSAGNGVTWSYDASTGELSFTGSGAIKDFSTVVDIPWKAYCPDVKKVTIGEGITKIGSYSLTWFESVDTIEVPEGVTELGKNAFAWCTSLKSVKLPASLKKIGDEAFACCSSLTAVEIPAGVESVESTAFLQCGKLSAITVSADNTALKASDGVLISGSKLLTYPAGKVGESYVIPDGITEICDSAFRENGNLKSVDLNGVTKVDSRAFTGCDGLTSVDFKNVTEIADLAFYGCKGLVNIALPSSLKSIGDSSFRACSELQLAAFLNDGTTIGSEAFESDKKVVLTSGINSQALKYANANSVPFYTMVNVVYGGSSVAFDPCAFIVSSGSTMVPMRGVFEMLGAEVSWDGNTKTATAVKDGVTVSIQIGSGVLYRNGEAVALAAPGAIIANRTYVPLRAVSEAFGNNVEWNHETKTASIS